MNNYLFVVSFQLMFYKTLRYRLARALRCLHTCVILFAIVKYSIISVQGKIKFSDRIGYLETADQVCGLKCAYFAYSALG